MDKKNNIMLKKIRKRISKALFYLFIFITSSTVGASIGYFFAKIYLLIV